MIVEALLAASVVTGPESVPESQYRGFHYEAKYEPFRKCVVWRESRNRVRAGGNGTGEGLYQFTGDTWRVYADRAGFPEWANRKASDAPRYVQDATFWVTVNPAPKRGGLRGAHHWSTVHAGAAAARIADCRVVLP